MDSENEKLNNTEDEIPQNPREAYEKLYLLTEVKKTREESLKDIINRFHNSRKPIKFVLTGIDDSIILYISLETHKKICSEIGISGKYQGIEGYLQKTSKGEADCILYEYGVSISEKLKKYKSIIGRDSLRRLIREKIESFLETKQDSLIKDFRK